MLYIKVSSFNDSFFFEVGVDLHAVPFKFRGLETIGIVVFLINIAAYLIIWALLLVRFYYYPYTFKASFMHPTESLFVPASIVSFGTILINISQYGPENTGPWLMRAVCILFWIDAALAVMFSAGIYLLLWSTQTFTIAQMTPIWIFPAYPMLIIGPHAGILSAKLDPSDSLPVIIGGTTIQGVGFLVSLMVYSAFIYRLMTQKLPRENLRPGMFVSVGPSGFTVAGLVNMAAEAKRSFPADFMGNGALAADVLKIVADFSCLWLWGYVYHLFCLRTISDVNLLTPYQIGDILLHHRQCGALVGHRAWANGLLNDLVLVHLPQHRSDHRHVCYRQSIFLQTHQYHWVCGDSPFAVDVLFRVLYDGSGHYNTTDSLASEG